MTWFILCVCVRLIPFLGCSWTSLVSVQTPASGMLVYFMIWAFIFSVSSCVLGLSVVKVRCAWISTPFSGFPSRLIFISTFGGGGASIFITSLALFTASSYATRSFSEPGRQTRQKNRWVHRGSASVRVSSVQTDPQCACSFPWCLVFCCCLQL